MAKKRRSKKKRFKKTTFTRRELKQKAVNYKGGACESCGYNRNLNSLSFHHRDPTQKDFGISRLITRLSWCQIEEEIDKCALLCLNCHSDVHSGLIDGYFL
jgi:hypothetical protein